MIKAVETQNGYDFFMDTGDDGRFRIFFDEVLKDTETGEVISVTQPNLTNISITGTARTAYNVDADSFDLPISKGDQTKEQGAFYITLSHRHTSQFREDNRPRKFQYDLQSVDANGWTTTFCKGTINFDQDNTY
ncbi:hypothetical protein [Aeromonas hydrophila]|uniref:Uncharacterized protein n=1 Tax=Aeromonas hydrophila TaxID=644 RepID=A0AAX3PB20_AERHY|nr:hypothetical protein [Aeromonas hydrophila]MDM5121012.1 hypothetical protein [Aeromonas hydrophila]WEE28297.1 hypothetical protein PY771_08265 [Aeromonas hydrophila]